jgi:hypothetical protein
MSTKVLVLGFDCVPSFHSGEVVSIGCSVATELHRAGTEPCRRKTQSRYNLS